MMTVWDEIERELTTMSETQGQRIKRTRLERELSTKHVAHSAGITTVLYEKIEADEHPCGEYLLGRIAVALGIFIEDLRVTTNE